MPSKSKTKGSSGERELCKLLSAIFEGSFTRVPNSGAMIGGTNAFRKVTLSEMQNRVFKGDIIPPDFMPRLVLECKWYKDFRFHSLLKPGPVPLLDEWLKQTLDSVHDGDVYFVCFKVNGRGFFVAAPKAYPCEVGNHAIYHSVHGDFIVTDFETYFTANRDPIKALCA